jgi:UDP-2,3-diacylglucosamine hydrolase
MEETKRNKIYFASDFHLGSPSYKASRKREKQIVAWLDEVKKDAKEIYLVGDIFDFWFEYKTVIPRGFVRLQGKIAEITDSGIPVHFFIGNHDMWIFDYIPKELGVILHKEPIEKEFDGKKFFIGHGDGLGPGDLKYKFLKKVFRSSVCQWLFARIHPNLGIGIANAWSKQSRASTPDYEEHYLGDDKEFLTQFCNETLKTKHYDFFIFGHRHLKLDIDLPQQSKYINLGEWFSQKSYGVWDGEKFELKDWSE